MSAGTGDEHGVSEAQSLLKYSESQIYHGLIEVLVILQKSHRVWLFIEGKVSHSCLTKWEDVSSHAGSLADILHMLKSQCILFVLSVHFCFKLMLIPVRIKEV